MSNPPGSSSDPLRQLADSLGQLVQTEVKRALDESTATPTTDPTLILQHITDRADQILASPHWKRGINRQVEEAFQTVLPALIKRFKSELETYRGSGSGSDCSLTDMIRSDEMKEMLDERFRAMLMYLKQDFVPKLLQQQG